MNLNVFIHRAFLGIVTAIITFGTLSNIAVAQFVGPTPRGSAISVEAARTAPIDTYVLVTGSIIASSRVRTIILFAIVQVTYGSRFRSGSGLDEWLRPRTRYNSLLRSIAIAIGIVYLWVQSLEIVK